MVTVTTFDQAAQARIAENVLKEAGVPVVVADETIVAMDWLLSNAVGGIKVQVWEEDAERAVTALEREFGENGEKLGTLDEKELAAEAEAAEREDEDESHRHTAAGDPPAPAGPVRRPRGGSSSSRGSASSSRRSRSTRCTCSSTPRSARVSYRLGGA